MTSAQLRRAFPPDALKQIDAAIRASESPHGGELRFVVEPALEISALWRGQSPRERAIELFSSLRVWDTEHNAGVLIYVLLADKSVEILADRGIHAKAGQDSWEAICRRMESHFRNQHYQTGALEGIDAITALLRSHFPRHPDDRNELPDSPLIIQ